MQVPQADSDFSSTTGVKEDLINFRPSPNFKNMKKFFKLKQYYEENEIKNMTKAAPDPPPPPNAENSECKTQVQPPLPLDPPPDDNIVPDNAGNHGDATNKPDVTSDVSETESKTKHTVKKTVCRDFIRGTCVRSGCRYAHTTDVSQEDLYRLYTFCRNFQSRFCAYANCKYVHATVFEEQEYYRSRYLPPHAFAHIIDKTSNSMNNNNNNKNSSMDDKLAKLLMPPPPPPPPRVAPRTDKKSAVNFAIPPPPLKNELEKQTHSVISPGSPETMKSMPAPMPQIAPTSLKRDWSIIEQFSNPPCKVDDTEPVPKKCKQCDTTEFRRKRRSCHRKRK